MRILFAYRAPGVPDIPWNPSSRRDVLVCTMLPSAFALILRATASWRCAALECAATGAVARSGKCRWKHAVEVA